jgi:nitrogen-specific signal transduction histidine kinase
MEKEFKHEQKDSSAFDDLMEGFQLISKDWRYLYVNNAIVVQSKCKSKEDLLGFTMMEKFPGIENTHMFAALKECMGTRVSRNLENEFKFPDGSKGWFELRIEPVREGVFILSMDITERKKIEELNRRHMEGLEEMIFMTSHRVRQPVTHILGVANLLNTVNNTQHELNKMAGYMKDSAKLLDDFTKELTLFIHEMKQKADNLQEQ